MSNYIGQAQQDKFVLKILKEKKDGYFLEIGSNDPVNINNTYVLEKNYNWKGIMVEYDASFLSSYKKHRPKSVYVLQDARKVNFKELFTNNKVPENIDYLQIDLEASNGSTLKTLQNLEKQVFNNYKFATVTFEHDIYSTNYKNTRDESRKIFKKYGYEFVFTDINNNGKNPYEDWYVYPDLVDMDYVNEIKNKNINNYKKGRVTKKFRYNGLPNIKKSMNWKDIEY
jgi:hypothetical protein